LLGTGEKEIPLLITEEMNRGHLPDGEEEESVY
jgi:hypothetical protein